MSNDRNNLQRIGDQSRETSETQVRVKINLDGTGVSEVDTPAYFLNHMLKLFAHHSGFDLNIYARGDTEIDDHHLVEDVALVLGRAFNEALGDKKGINRYADLHLPMDEALVLVAVDLSGRPHLSYGLEFPSEKVGNFEVVLFKEFYKSFVNEAKITLHLKQLAGEDPHHIAEASFKGLGQGLKKAVAISGDGDAVPSTKGSL